MVLEETALVVFDTFEKAWGVATIEESIKIVVGSVVVFARKLFAVV